MSTPAIKRSLARCPDAPKRRCRRLFPDHRQQNESVARQLAESPALLRIAANHRVRAAFCAARVFRLFLLPAAQRHTRPWPLPVDFDIDLMRFIVPELVSNRDEFILASSSPLGRIRSMVWSKTKVVTWREFIAHVFGKPSIEYRSALFMKTFR